MSASIREMIRKNAAGLTVETPLGAGMNALFPNVRKTR